MAGAGARYKTTAALGGWLRQNKTAVRQHGGGEVNKLKQKLRCWLLKRLLGDTFTLTVRVNSLGFPILPIGTFIVLRPGNCDDATLPMMMVGDFETLDPIEPCGSRGSGSKGFRRYQVEFLKK